MTRPRPARSAVTTIEQVLARLRAVENRGRDVLTPVRISDAFTVTGSSPTAAFVALVNATGAQITWWVLVNVTGSTVSLRLRDATGGVGEAVSTSADGVVAVRMPVGQSWEVGDQRLVYLDASVNTGSATVLPVRALVA